MGPLFTLSITLLFGLQVFAASAFYSTEEVVDRYYYLMCGPKSESHQQSEVQEARKKFQNFLRYPQAEATRILEEGVEGDTGKLELLMICGSVVRFAKRLTTEYCMNDNNNAIGARRAIAFCEAFEQQGRRPTGAGLNPGL